MMTSYKIVGLLQACNFLLWERCFEYFCSVVDELYVRFDSANTPLEMKNKIISHPKVKKTIEGEYIPDGWSWREPLLRLLDKVKPDIVVVLDIDEMFDGDIKEEIWKFWKSDKKAMLCYYNQCPTETGERTDIYPTQPHMMVFKWMENLTYTNYKGYAQITNYANNPSLVWQGSVKVDHFCMWTKEMERIKKEQAIKKYGRL